MKQTSTHLPAGIIGLDLINV